MRILANDGLNEEAVALLKKEGFTVETEKRSTEDLLGEIGDFDALLVRSATKVTRAVIEAGTKNGGKLKIVGRGGVGTDNIDLEAAKECGVIVKFAPNGNTNATAEHALGLMFAIARRVPMAHHCLKSGVWHKKRFAGNELHGKTLGVIGCGRIGQSLVQDHPGDGREQGGVRARAKAQPDVGVADQIDGARIDDHQGSALAPGLQHAEANDGVALGGVGADDDHAVAGSHVPQLPDGVGHGAAAKGSGQTGHAGGVSEPGAVVDVVGADAGAQEFLEEVVLLVGAAGAAQPSHGVGAERCGGSGQAVGDKCQGLVPGGRGQPAVSSDKRGGQAIGVVDEIEAEPALGAQRPLVDRRFRSGRDADDAAIRDLQGQGAADAAVGTNRMGALHGHALAQSSCRMGLLLSG